MEKEQQSARMDFSCLQEDILCEIAYRLVPSRWSIEAMRAVCRHWRQAVPPTRGPWLVMSEMDTTRPTVFLAVVGGILVRQNLLFEPPWTDRCWSCCEGLMALSVPAPNSGYSMCVNCNRRHPVAPIPQNLNLTNLSETAQLLCAISTDRPLIYWTYWTSELEEQWNPFSYNLAGVAPRSIDWRGGIACVAAAPSSVLIDGIFEERLLPVNADLPVPQHPPPTVINFDLNLDPTQAAWGLRGHHVFTIGIRTFVCVLLWNSEDNSVQVRLFQLCNDIEGFSVIPAEGIGNYSVFLGSNQAFASVSTGGLIPNSAYIVDNDGFFQAAQVININFSTGQQMTIPYPLEIAQNLNNFMPPSWLDPLPIDELDWHCNA